MSQDKERKLLWQLWSQDLQRDQVMHALRTNGVHLTYNQVQTAFIQFDWEFDAWCKSHDDDIKGFTYEACFDDD